MKYLASKASSLLEVLRKMYPDSSNTTLKNMLKYRRVSVDGNIIVKKDYFIQCGQTVCVSAVQDILPDNVKIIYEDRDIIIVNKPVRMLSDPLDAGKCKYLLTILNEHFHTSHVHAVHRIDKETSGIMIFAKRKESVIPLNKMFKKHELTRGYIAVVQGNMRRDKGTWESTLLEHNNYDVRSTTNTSEGKKAITHYSVFHRSRKFSYLKLFLETGRKHQIRVHCKDAGHPIVGDKRYGNSSVNPISRMCLHASLLEFVHPFTQKKMSFSSPTPPEFSKLGLIHKII